MCPQLIKIQMQDEDKKKAIDYVFPCKGSFFEITLKLAETFNLRLHIFMFSNRNIVFLFQI